MTYHKKVKEGKVIWRKLVKTKTDYINNYIFKDDKPEMFRFDDGYYSFDKNGKLDGCHLFVKDYQGNVRMVVNAQTDSVEQVNHYYPYGALMGDISTGQNFQKYKYSGKELDRQFGLDWYDFHARQQDPLLGRFNSIDPLDEKTPQISPYAYCGGDPINYVDLNGLEPTPFEAWLMAAASYRDEYYTAIIDALSQLGWNIYDNSKLNGPVWNELSKMYSYNSMVFSKTTDDKTEYCLSFAGTSDEIDVTQDIMQLSGNSVQYAMAVTEAKSLSEYLGENAELTLVGHSLGGGDAIAGHLKTGRKAITFNPAYLSEATLSQFGFSRENANVTNYQAKGDELAWSQNLAGMKPIGTTIIIDTDFPFANVGPYHPVAKFQKRIVSPSERKKLGTKFPVIK